MHYFAVALLFYSASCVLASTETVCVPDVGITRSVRVTSATPPDPLDPCGDATFEASLNEIFSDILLLCNVSIVNGTAECTPREGTGSRRGTTIVDISYNVIILCDPLSSELQDFFEARADALAQFVSQNSDPPRNLISGGRVRVSAGIGVGIPRTGTRGTGTRGTGRRGSGRSRGKRTPGTGTAGQSGTVAICNGGEIDISGGVAGTCSK